MREPKIYETAGGYGFRLDIGTDPVTGKRLQRRFYRIKKTEARRALSQKQYEISSGRYVDSQDIKLGDFLKRWLDHKSKNVSSGTMANYRPFVMNHLIPNLGNIKMHQLKPGQIQELYDEYVEEETLSNQSIVHMHRILNNAYKKAIEWEIVTKNPCVAVKPPKPEKHRLQVWDETEVQFFLDMAKEDRFYIAYLLALSTGMRKGEILGLRWQDIDFTNQILSVNQAVTRKKEADTRLALKTEKSYRNISLFDYVVTELKKYRHEQMKFKMENRKTYKDQDLVLASSTGSFILPRNLDRNWLDLIEKSALKPIRFHDMRHTHATILLKQGVHPKVVQERLGHSSITVTLDTYSHVLPNIQKAAAEKFGEQIFGNKPDSKHDILG